MGLLQADDVAQTGIFTGGGVGLTGHVLHFRDAGLQRFVFRLQRLIAEHIAVVPLGGAGQGGAGCPEGGQNALNHQLRDASVGQTGHDREHGGEQDRNDHQDAQFGIEKLSHGCVSSKVSGRIFFSACPRRQTGRPITL